MLTDRPAASIAHVSLATVFADARPGALLAPASSAILLADARAAALLASAFYAVVTVLAVGILVDSEIDLSTRNGNTRVFINSR